MIHPNVEIGPGTVIDDDVEVGRPPRGGAPGELPTRIGSDCVIRSHTIIYAGTTLGDRVNVGHGAMIREDNVVGSDCSIGTHAVLEVGNRIGDGTRVHTGCFLEYVTLGDRVFLGPHVVFTDDPHPMCPRFRDCVKGAIIEADVSIGANATILPGVRIGEGALIGAGSVVTRDVAPAMVAAGSPARVIKAVSELRCFMGFFERPYVWRELVER